MRRLGWSIVLSFVVAGVAGTVVAQGAPTPSRAPTVSGAPEALEPRVTAAPVQAEKPARLLDDAIELKVIKVSDGRVLGGHKMPKAALDQLARLGFARVTAAGAIKPDSIHDERLYRSYKIAADAKVKAEDFERYEGREVRVKVQEVFAGRVYAIVDIVR